MEKIFENIYGFNIGVESELKNILKDEIIEQHKNKKYDEKSLSFKLNCEKEVIKNFSQEIYSVFVEKCRELFPNLRIINMVNRSNLWAYVINQNEYRENIHSHIRTAVIVGVYYLSIPKDKSPDIIFYNDYGNEIFRFTPTDGDFIIFPNYLLHNIEKSETDEYRIAINMELICDEVWI